MVHHLEPGEVALTSPALVSFAAALESHFAELWLLVLSGLALTYALLDSRGKPF